MTTEKSCTKPPAPSDSALLSALKQIASFPITQHNTLAAVLRSIARKAIHYHGGSHD